MPPEVNSGLGKIVEFAKSAVRSGAEAMLLPILRLVGSQHVTTSTFNEKPIDQPVENVPFTDNFGDPKELGLFLELELLIQNVVTISNQLSPGTYNIPADLQSTIVRTSEGFFSQKNNIMYAYINVPETPLSNDFNNKGLPWTRSIRTNRMPNKNMSEVHFSHTGNNPEDKDSRKKKRILEVDNLGKSYHFEFTFLTPNKANPLLYIPCSTIFYRDNNGLIVNIDIPSNYQWETNDLMLQRYTRLMLIVDANNEVIEQTLTILPNVVENDENS